MSSDPKVSVVIPCHNLGLYLDEAVDSVLGQTLQEFEIIVVDDGSTDPQTTALLSHYQRRRTRVLHTPNRGLSAARNHGIQHAAADYICALDADDKLEPTWLEKAVSTLDRDPSLSFVSHWLRTFGDEEWEWKPTECDLVALLDWNSVNGAALVRRADVLAVGGFDETMRDGCEDWDLWLRMVERGRRGTIIPEVLFFYRRRLDSMSRAMLREPTYSRLMRGFIEKHEESYRAYLGELLLRRERRLWPLRVGIHDLRLEHETWLRPQLARQRREVEALRQKLECVQREQEQARAAVELAAEKAVLQGSLQHAQQRAAEQSRELDQRTEEAARQEAEVRALRDSMSWRITGPLRSVYSWLSRPRRSG